MKGVKAIFAFCACSALLLSGCGGTGGDNSGDNGGENPPGKEEITCEVYPVEYEEVNAVQDMEAFFAQTRDSNGSSHDGKLEYGFVDGVWHTLKVNDEDVSVYSARCGTNVHSFAWVDVDTNAQDGKLNLNVKLELLTKDKSEVVILPEKLEESATYSDGAVSATLNHYGSHSFVFDKEPDKALTLYVAPCSELKIPTGWEEVTISAGEHTREELTFTQQNTVYHFGSGAYDVYSMSFPSNSIAYFDSGAYFRVHEEMLGDYWTAFRIDNAENVKVQGRAIFDFSDCQGGESKTKGVYSIGSSKNVTVEGLITVNSNGWTMCADASQNVEISRCMFFSYRTFSDGIMLSDCMDSGAHDNFVRTGDDAIEVKAFSQNTDPEFYTKNIVYENNCVWTDKGIGYGCIYECIKPVDGVTFRNNSIGFAQAAWSDHLGCATVQMGSVKGTTWQNIHFEDMEVYSSSCALISIFNRANNETEGGVIKNVYCKNITLKYATKTQRDVYALSVIIKLLNGAVGSNCRTSGIYLDNIMFAGTAITPENYTEYTYKEIAEGATFSNSAIKVNSLS